MGRLMISGTKRSQRTSRRDSSSVSSSDSLAEPVFTCASMSGRMPSSAAISAGGRLTAQYSEKLRSVRLG